MTSAVIIILREVLEAMLLVCMLMASSAAMGYKLRWLPFAILAGFSGAFAYAIFLDEISMAFDGFGQEIVNASLLITIALLLVMHNFIATKRLMTASFFIHEMVVGLIMGAVIAIAMTREGAEIYLYVYSYGLVAGQASSVLAGGAIGAGIGFSFGTFGYYALRALTPRRCLQVSCIIGLVASAGSVSQAARYLTQADLLPSQATLWDSSGIIPESSLVGELLHATIGYEASPTLTQFSLYMAAMLLMIGVMGFAYYSTRNASSVRTNTTSSTKDS
ncbi:MAG: FTR1 family protein [Pseudohongiellaceae bacterium]